MTDLGFLTEFMVPVIVGICLCVGYVVKKWIKDVDNKYIPTICAVLDRKSTRLNSSHSV